MTATLEHLQTNALGIPEKRMPRARQNVIFEMGMLLAKIGRPRVAVLIKDPSKIERPSDIQGLIYIPFIDNLEKEVGVTLAKEMVKQVTDNPVHSQSKCAHRVFGAAKDHHQAASFGLKLDRQSADCVKGAIEPAWSRNRWSNSLRVCKVMPGVCWVSSRAT